MTSVLLQEGRCGTAERQDERAWPGWEAYKACWPTSHSAMFAPTAKMCEEAISILLQFTVQAMAAQLLDQFIAPGPLAQTLFIGSVQTHNFNSCYATGGFTWLGIAKGKVVHI